MRYLQLRLHKSLLIAKLIGVGWLYLAASLNVTYALPNDLQIAFAKASKRVETGNAAARCLIVWLTHDLSTQNIYCTYIYPLKGQFCDKPNGIKFDNIRLEYATNMADNLSQWFSNKYPWHYHQITREEITQILKFLSHETLEGAPNRGAWHGKMPDTILLLDQEMPDELGLYDVRYQNVPQKIFAFLVHYNLPKKIDDINANIIQQTEFTPISMTAQQVAAQQMAAQPIMTDTKPTQPNPPNDGIMLPQHYLTLLAVGVVSLIFVMLVWFFVKRNRYFRKINTSLIAEYSDHYPWLDSEDSTKSQLPLRHNKRQSPENTIKHKLKAEQHKNKEIATLLKNTEAERNKLSKQYENELTQHQQAQKRVRKANDQIKALRQAKQALQTVLYERFRFLKPDNFHFLQWTKALIEQPGTWRWLQSELSVELLVFEPIVTQIQNTGSKREQQILELLHVDNLMIHWEILINQFFDSNQQLWPYLQNLDNGHWLNQLLRADDVLQAYFSTEDNLKLLSQRMSNLKGILQTAFAEMGVTVMSPQILDKVPSHLPANQRCEYPPDTRLKALVKPQVQQLFPETHEFIVDIEKYGFVTPTHPNAAADVRVFVSKKADWEDSGS